MHKVANVNTPAFWDKQFKEEYAAWKKQKGFIRWNPDRYELVASLLPAEGKILDMGCGLGHFCRYLRARRPFAYDIYGYDFSGWAVEKAQELDEHTNYVHIVDAADKSDDPKNIVNQPTFDAIVAQEIIEHLSDVPAFLQNIKEIGKPGATVIITTPWRRGNPAAVRSDDHIHEFSRAELVGTLEAICEDGMIFDPIPRYDRETDQVYVEPTLVYRGKLK